MSGWHTHATERPDSYGARSLAFMYDIKLGMLGMEAEQQGNDQQGHATGGPRRKVDLLLTSLARQNLSSMYRALQRMEHYWAGISFVLSVLNQKAKGELFIV